MVDTTARLVERFLASHVYGHSIQGTGGFGHSNLTHLPYLTCKQVPCLLNLPEQTQRWASVSQDQVMTPAPGIYDSDITGRVMTIVIALRE